MASLLMVRKVDDLMAINLKPLYEQCVVITGATSSIGLATARRVAKSGARVVLVARNEEALQEEASSLRRERRRVAICVADIADDDFAQRVGSVAEEEFGGFDSWVNNAATSLFADLADVTMEEHQRVFDVGYFGTVRGSLYGAEQLRERGGGAIINVGSVLGDRSVLLQGPYCAMKSAVHGFTDTLRMELERDNASISVTTIKPN
jgi:short-subunit dehydrogenase